MRYLLEIFGQEIKITLSEALVSQSPKKIFKWSLEISKPTLALPL